MSTFDGSMQKKTQPGAKTGAKVGHDTDAPPNLISFMLKNWNLSKFKFAFRCELLLFFKLKSYIFKGYLSMS